MDETDEESEDDEPVVEMPKRDPKTKSESDKNFRIKVLEHFKVFIECGVAPRKDMIQEFLRNLPAELSNKATWDSVKNTVWNEIKKQSKKKSQSQDNFREKVLQFFDAQIQEKTKPTETDCRNFLLSLNSTSTIPWQSVQSIVVGETNKKKKTN